MGIRLAGVDPASGRDCGLGLFLPYEISGAELVSGNEAAIVAAVLPVEGSWTELTVLSGLDVPRTVNCEISVDAAATDLEVVFRIKGITSYGERVTEDVTVSSVTTVESNYAYRQIDSISTNVTTPTDVDASDRIRVGLGPTYGLPVKIGAITDVLFAWYGLEDQTSGVTAWTAQTIAAAATTDTVGVSVLYGTIAYDDATAAGSIFKMFIQSTYNALDTTR